MSRVIVVDPGPASQVQRALVEHMAIAGREQVRGKDHKGVGPDQEAVLHTPPLVIVKVALKNKQTKITLTVPENENFSKKLVTILSMLSISIQGWACSVASHFLKKVCKITESFPSTCVQVRKS